MSVPYGFSFLEILIALVLLTTVSLTLLSHQWHLRQVLNQVNREVLLRLEQDNVFEWTQATLL
jgi:prepilin-type N-terminal cleavage/methylation domain-containing protein